MRVARHSDLFKRLYNYKFKFNYSYAFFQKLIKNGFFFRAVNFYFEFIVRLRGLFGFVDLNNFFKKIFEKYRPKIACLVRKVAAKYYNLPFFMNSNRSNGLLIRWLIKNANNRYEFKFVDRLVNEFVDLKKGIGRTAFQLEEYYNILLK